MSDESVVNSWHELGRRAWTHRRFPKESEFHNLWIGFQRESSIDKDSAFTAFSEGWDTASAEPATPLQLNWYDLGYKRGQGFSLQDKLAQEFNEAQQQAQRKGNDDSTVEAYKQFEAGWKAAFARNAPPASDVTAPTPLTDAEGRIVLDGPPVLLDDDLEAIHRRWLTGKPEDCHGDSICEQAMIDIQKMYIEIVRLRNTINGEST